MRARGGGGGVSAIAWKQGSFSSSRSRKSPDLHAWRVTGVARDGQDEETAPTEAVGCTIGGGQEAKTQILVEGITYEVITALY